VYEGPGDFALALQLYYFGVRNLIGEKLRGIVFQEILL
jgi:hypothetical protein